MTNGLILEKEISVVISGEAGQGIELVTDLAAKTLKQEGYNVFSSKEYMSRVRGGCNSSTIRVSSAKSSAYKEKIDFLFAMSKDAIKHLEKRISKDTVVFYEDDHQEFSQTVNKKVKLAFSAIAKELGGSIYINVICLGIISGILDINSDLSKKYLQQYFSGKTSDVIEKNLIALQKGYDIGINVVKEQQILINIDKNIELSDEIYINGNDAVAMGCIAGGCDFVSSYPMSPSTGVFTYMAQHSDDFNIIVEQAEDEIAAMNFGLGAWYAGARAMTTTAGGGFALMTEAVSLSGMTETPMVVYLAQRPAPATGLPTRTEQGDLNLSLYAGHGEFPRIILAPGTLEDGFYLAQQAFNLADEFQVPVFILADQYFIDFAYNTKPFDIEQTEITEHIVSTSTDYKRYELTQNGISPRGIPGLGEGLVVLDSDEHDQEGHITEDLDLRIKMVDKRLKKLESIKQVAISPVLVGNSDYKTLVIGWGSTFYAIKEALQEINNPDISFLYFKQVYPLPDETSDFLKKAQKTICVENNATGQFANLLKLYADYSVDKKILKYNGEPFSVEELVSKIKEEVEKMSVFDKQNIDIAWCPGCGDFGILNILKSVLNELSIEPKDLVVCSGIGQAAKTPHYLNCNVFNGLHGRALPPATAIKIVNSKLNVIVVSGDGDIYGEGGNHFISAIRRNPNITNIVNNNMVYGLTKGQASPSSPQGFVTPTQPKGVSLEPFNPISLAIAQDVSFVARAFCADVKQTKEIFKKAILHKGYALVDVFQPCVTFDKIHTYAWFKENTYYLEETYDCSNRIKAFERSIETGKFPLGVFYTNPNKEVFEETPSNRRISSMGVFERRQNRKEKLMEHQSKYKD